MGQKYNLFGILLLLFVGSGCGKETSQEVDAEAAFFLGEAQQAFEQDAYNIALAFRELAEN